MNPFGDGSNGALNLTSGTTNLLLNTKYQFTTVSIGAGATLSTNSTTGSVLYICATDSITIDGAIDVSGKVTYGNASYSVTIDGQSFTSPGVANGSAGSFYSGQTQALQSNGFGGGGSGGSVTGALGGNGGNGSATSGSGGSSVSITANTNETKGKSGNNGGGSSGGSGGAYAQFTRVSGTVVGQTFSGNSGVGGSSWGQNGSNGGHGWTIATGGDGSWTHVYFTGGGGGGGGRAGRPGVHVVLKSPTIVINGSVITSGTNGGNGGNGGRDALNGSFTNAWGMPGGGGGGGRGGNIELIYAGTLDIDSATLTRSGGAGGSGGIGGPSQSITGGTGVSGASGSLTTTQVKPIANFTANVTTGARPLAVDFTNLSKGALIYDWDFGDGGTSEDENPSHIYTDVGTYTVTLTATNEEGDTVLTKTNYITTTIATYQRSASGTLLFGGGAIRQLLAKRSAGGTLVFSGNAALVILRDVEGIEEKQFLFKVYDPDGNYLETWSDEIINVPEWSEELNTAGSSMVLELARNSDSKTIDVVPLLDSDGSQIVDSNSFPILTTVESRNQVGPGSSVNHNNRVDIWIYYGSIEPLQDSDGLDILDSDGNPILTTIGAPNGVRRFTGFISQINTRYGETDTTEVTLTSYGFDLDQFPVTDDDGKTTVAFNSYDPGDIVKDGLDKFTADSAGFGTYTTYTPATVQTTGTVVSYPFRVNTYLELLKKSIELAPSDYFFYVDLGTNFVNFRQRSSTPQHIFVLGKHIKNLNLRSYIEDSTNDVIFTGGGDPALFKRYTETPATGTRRRLTRISDNRVELESSADILAEGEIERNNKIQYRSTVTILEKVYDIERIRLGDVIGFRNFDNYVDGLTMQIVALHYTPDAITLQLDTLSPNVNKRLEDIKRNLALQENVNVPDEPDV